MDLPKLLAWSEIYLYHSPLVRTGKLHVRENYTLIAEDTIRKLTPIAKTFVESTVGMSEDVEINGMEFWMLRHGKGGPDLDGHWVQGTNKIVLENIRDPINWEDFNRVVTHEIVHFLQFQKPAYVGWTRYYHYLYDIGRFNFIDDETSFTALKEEIPRLKQIFPGSAKFQEMVSKAENIQPGDKTTLQNVAITLAMYVHINAPHEIESVIHEYYERVKDHIRSPKFFRMIEKFNIKTTQDWIRTILRHLPNIELLVDLNLRRVVGVLVKLVEENSSRFTQAGVY